MYSPTSKTIDELIEEINKDIEIFAKGYYERHRIYISFASSFWGDKKISDFKLKDLIGGDYYLQKKAYLAVVIENRKGADCKVKILLSRYPNDKIEEIILSHIQK